MTVGALVALAIALFAVEVALLLVWRDLRRAAAKRGGER